MEASSRRKGHPQSLYEALCKKILSGEYAPGTRLPAERDLVAIYGVNRGAVREALNRLNQLRLVSTVHGGGTRVQDFRTNAGLDLLINLLLTGDAVRRYDVIRSLVEMRTTMAADAARLAATRRTEPQSTELTLLSAKLADINEDAELQALLLLMWEKIIDASCNLAYRLAYNTLHDCYLSFGSAMNSVIRKSFNADHYVKMINAIETKNVLKAERYARTILENDAAVLMDFLSLNQKTHS